MCSINLNNFINEQLESLEGKRDAFEAKIGRLAFAANQETPGPLDALETHRTRMPDALRDVRKRRVGRHRFYYTGHNTDCCYNAFYLILNKKADDRQGLDDTKDFQKHLAACLADKAIVRVLEDPAQTPPELTGGLALNPAQDWQDADWYKQYVEPYEE